VDQFRISATSRWPNYLPEFVASELGFFAAENLLVERWVASPWEAVLHDVNAGRAEAALGGIWVPAMYFQRRKYVVFAQLNGRFPMAVVTRAAHAPFTWQSLPGSVVLVPGTGGAAPYLFLAGFLREQGVDPSLITFVHDLSNDMFVELFSAGTGDALMTDALTAASLVQRGVAHWAARFNDVGGAVPNSVYYGLPELLAREDRLAWRFTRALHQAMKWVQEHPADDVASLLRTHWPEADQAVLTDVIDDFRRTGLWADSVLVSKPAYERWHHMLAVGGLLSAHVDYVDLVDVGPAQDALTSATTTSAVR